MVFYSTILLFSGILFLISVKHNYDRGEKLSHTLLCIARSVAGEVCAIFHQKLIYM